MWDDFLRACALMLVFEGMMPFIAPDRWRNMVQTIGSMNNKTLRNIGLASMLAGITLLYLVNGA